MSGESSENVNITAAYLEVDDESIFDIQTHSSGPSGTIELTDDILKALTFRKLLWVESKCGHGMESKGFPWTSIFNSQ